MRRALFASVAIHAAALALLASTRRDLAAASAAAPAVPARGSASRFPSS